MNTKEKPLTGQGQGASDDDKSNDLSTVKQSITDQEEFTKLFQLARSYTHNTRTIEEIYSGERSRAYWFILYPESMNPKTLEILNSGQFQGALSPLHDGDHWENGDKKKKHFHCLFYFPGRISPDKLEEIVKEVFHGVKLQRVLSLVGACRYLAHMDIDPDNIPEDKGKVHYSPDDIITFGGFDVMSYIKATATQKSKTLKKLYALIEDNNFTSYDLFIKYLYDCKPEFEFSLVDSHLTGQLLAYIRSRYARLHMNDENIRLKEVIRLKDEQIDDLFSKMNQQHDDLQATMNLLNNVIEKMNK